MPILPLGRLPSTSSYRVSTDPFWPVSSTQRCIAAPHSDGVRQYMYAVSTCACCWVSMPLPRVDELGRTHSAR